MHMEALSHTRYVTLVLRLVLNHTGRLSHGELIDAESGRAQSFRDRAELLQILTEWLTQLESTTDEVP